jgi:hypothetical protein
VNSREGFETEPIWMTENHLKSGLP